MSRRLGRELNGVSEPHKRESHIGRISTVGSGGRKISVDNMNNSQLRNLVPIMPYGVASSPPIGLMSFVLASNNSGRDGIIGVYDPNKPSCDSGDCMLYSSGGAKVHCKGNTVLINSRDTLKELDDSSIKVNDLSNQLKNLSTKVDNLSTKIDNLSNELNSLSSDVSGLSNELNSLSSDVSGLSNKVNSLV